MCVLHVVVTMKDKFTIMFSALYRILFSLAQPPEQYSSDGTAGPQLTFAIDRFRDFTDGRGDSSSSN